MMAPRPTLETFRDIVIIVGMAVLAFTGIQGTVSRMQERQDQAVRFSVIQQAVQQLETQYRQQLSGVTNLNTIVLKQNELLIEYQKLLLQTEFLPASAVKIQAPPKPAAPTPAPQPPKSKP